MRRRGLADGPSLAGRSARPMSARDGGERHHGRQGRAHGDVDGRPKQVDEARNERIAFAQAGSAGQAADDEARGPAKPGPDPEIVAPWTLRQPWWATPSQIILTAGQTNTGPRISASSWACPASMVKSQEPRSTPSTPSPSSDAGGACRAAMRAPPRAPPPGSRWPRSPTCSGAPSNNPSAGHRALPRPRRAVAGGVIARGCPPCASSPPGLTPRCPAVSPLPGPRRLQPPGPWPAITPAGRRR